MTTTPDPGAAGDDRRLHPWSWLFVLIGSVRQFLVPLLVLVIFGGRREDGVQLAVAGVAVAVLALLAVWRYFTYRYRIEGDSLFIRSGLLERSLRQVPFSRIHNVELRQTLLHRLFGVAEVTLESAGGSKPEAQMRVLRMGEALALERLIRHRGHAAGDATAQAPEEDAQTLLALPTAEIVRLGLVSNRGMIVVGAALALASQVMQDNLFRRAFDFVRGEASGYVASFDCGGPSLALAAIALVLLALALLRVFSVLLALVRYHGFRLQAHGRRLTVERGLLARVRSSVSRRRIQAWTLRESVLHRLFRRRSLAIDTAGAQLQGGEGGQSREPPELAPIATPAACDALLQDLLADAAWPPRDWQPLHPRAWLRLWLGDLVVAALLAAALCWHFGAWGLLGLLWLPWGGWLALRHARFAGWHVDARLVAVREGWWSRHWRFAEIDKLQALQLRQSPLDRRFGMASVWLDTAGAGAASPPLRVRHLPEAQARMLYVDLGREIARRRLRW
ncbi:PH domain-containing protein [Luteimonas sp. M1R5S18]|uniref:PH domain-containing protein n=1 Tax=Luteimonas rhizosphaericola TaxID=3042024 RepID=A0ABT6JKP1_9GAMM|nr:PH domain-containing protein [Luteimonas rhizosphaericola]MDH5830586.1 PH domain-containing protein [Luteimonas rhizosphaericola]